MIYDIIYSLVQLRLSHRKPEHSVSNKNIKINVLLFTCYLVSFLSRLEGI